MTRRTYTSRRQYTNFVQISTKTARCRRCKREIESRYRYCYHCVMAFRRRQLAGDNADKNRTLQSTQRSQHPLIWDTDTDKL